MAETELNKQNNEKLLIKQKNIELFETLNKSAKTKTLVQFLQILIHGH